MKRLRGADFAEAGLDLDWEASRLYRGAGLALALAYVSDLWRMSATIAASPRAPANASSSLRQTAFAFGLYALELVMLDGLKCADDSAPSHRLDQVVSEYRPVWQYARGLTDAERARAVQVAVSVEQATAPVRRDDAVLCSGGMPEMRAGLASGAAPQQVPTPPGMVGKTYAVPAPRAYKPQFLAPEQWRPRQDARRAQMTTVLTRIVTPPPAGTPPPKPAGLLAAPNPRPSSAPR